MAAEWQLLRRKSKHVGSLLGPGAQIRIIVLVGEAWQRAPALICQGAPSLFVTTLARADHHHVLNGVT